MDYVLASSNEHKLREIQQIFGVDFRLTPQRQYGVEAVEETGATFVENAILKAREASRLAGLPAIADDSGLEVDALKGAPGIYSARYAGTQASDADNIKKLLQDLVEVPAIERSARFQCVIVVLRYATDPTPIICQGTWQGQILETPQGESGFGYDPVFLCPEHGVSAAELAPEVKNQISHRARALKQLREKITE